MDFVTIKSDKRFCRLGHGLSSNENVNFDLVVKPISLSFPDISSFIYIKLYPINQIRPNMFLKSLSNDVFL